jgi:hypothetical protein
VVVVAEIQIAEYEQVLAREELPQNRRLCVRESPAQIHVVHDGAERVGRRSGLHGSRHKTG